MPRSSAKPSRRANQKSTPKNVTESTATALPTLPKSTSSKSKSKAPTLDATPAATTVVLDNATLDATKTTTTHTKLTPEDRERRHLMCRISGYMRRSEDTFKAVSLVLSLLEKSTDTLSADDMWSKVSRYDRKYYQNVYKKRRNSVNPLRLANVKRPKTDYAFFTQETYTTVAATNKDAKFGTISKMIKGMWDALPADSKAKYAELASQDNVRYYNAKKHVLGMLDGSVKPKTKADKEICAKLQTLHSNDDESK